MKAQKSIESGIAGAVALTILHETIKRVDSQAPRMDLLGMNAIGKALKAFDKKQPDRNTLFSWALLGDIIGNSIYYSAIGVSRRRDAYLRGALLGLSAGIGAIALPKSVKGPESHRSARTKFLTVGLYIMGGLVAAAVYKKLNNKDITKIE